jgi:transcriptional regulator with XRE-family HTH domain
MATANPIDLHVGMRMRLRRIGMGLSARQLAQNANLLEEEILRFEAGRERADALRLQRIARAMQTPASYFFGSPIVCTDLDAAIELEAVNRRLHVRIETRKDAVASIVGAARRVEIVNISRGGAKMTNLTVEDVGKSVELFIAGQRHIGTIVWAKSNTGGVSFSSLIPSKAVEIFAAN